MGNNNSIRYRDPEHGAWHKAERIAAGIGWIELVFGNKKQNRVTSQDLSLISSDLAKPTSPSHFLSINQLVPGQFYDVLNNNGIWREAQLLEIRGTQVYVEFSGLLTDACWLSSKRRITERNKMTDPQFIVHCVRRLQQKQHEERIENERKQKNLEEKRRRYEEEIKQMEYYENLRHRKQFDPLQMARKNDTVFIRSGHHGGDWIECSVRTDTGPFYKSSPSKLEVIESKWVFRAEKRVFVVEHERDIRWECPKEFSNIRVNLEIKVGSCYDMKFLYGSYNYTWLHACVISKELNHFKVHISGERFPCEQKIRKEHMAAEFYYTDRQRVKETISALYEKRKELAEIAYTKMEENQKEEDVIEFLYEEYFFGDEKLLQWSFEKNGWTLLHLATYYGYVHVCCLLYSAHPMLTKIKDHKQKLPIQIAIEQRHLSIFQFLFQQSTPFERQQPNVTSYKMYLESKGQSLSFEPGDKCKLLLTTDKWISAKIESIDKNDLYHIVYEDGILGVAQLENIFFKVFDWEDKEENSKCCVCFIGEKDHIFLPCGHICICKDCSIEFDKCPICRRGVESVHQTFVS